MNAFPVVYTLMLNMLSIYSMSIQLISISTPLGIDYHDKLVKRDTIDSSLASSPSISSTSFFSTAGSSLVSNPRFNHLFPHSFIVSLNIPTRDWRGFRMSDLLKTSVCCCFQAHLNWEHNNKIIRNGIISIALISNLLVVYNRSTIYPSFLHRTTSSSYQLHPPKFHCHTHYKEENWIALNKHFIPRPHSYHSTRSGVVL